MILGCGTFKACSLSRPSSKTAAINFNIRPKGNYVEKCSKCPVTMKHGSLNLFKNTGLFLVTVRFKIFLWKVALKTLMSLEYWNISKKMYVYIVQTAYVWKVGLFSFNCINCQWKKNWKLHCLPELLMHRKGKSTKMIVILWNHYHKVCKFLQVWNFMTC